MCRFAHSPRPQRQVEDWEPSSVPSAAPARSLPPLPPRDTLPPQRRGMSKNQKTAGAGRAQPHTGDALTYGCAHRGAAAAIAIGAVLLLSLSRDSMTPVRNVLAGRLGAPRRRTPARKPRLAACPAGGCFALTHWLAVAQRGPSSPSLRTATCCCAARWGTRTTRAVRLATSPRAALCMERAPLA
jgi:hypothetical protein